MIYDKALTIAADTAIASPASESLPVVQGIVKQVFLTFPGGCAGLVGVRVLYSERVVWPTNPDTWFIADNVTFDFAENVEVDDKPFLFTLEGYNLDCVYEHTVTLRMTILREEPDLLSVLLAMRQDVRDTSVAIDG